MIYTIQLFHNCFFRIKQFMWIQIFAYFYNFRPISKVILTKCRQFCRDDLIFNFQQHIYSVYLLFQWKEKNESPQYTYALNCTNAKKCSSLFDLFFYKLQFFFILFLFRYFYFIRIIHSNLRKSMAVRWWTFRVPKEKKIEEIRYQIGCTKPVYRIE